MTRDFTIMNNYEVIKEMDISDMADFLLRIEENVFNTLGIAITNEIRDSLKTSVIEMLMAEYPRYLGVVS